jgi:uncharacterized membrane protein
LIRLQEWISYFFIYSLIGWIIESVYKSLIFKKTINSGFLIGPFVPVYGFGAVTLLIIDQYISTLIPFGFRLIIYTILTNIIEYNTGTLLEEVFHMKLWDYSNMFLNIKGRVCLLHSLFWMGLSWILLEFIHPFIKNIATQINEHFLFITNYILIIYIMFDIIYSTKLMNNLVSFISSLAKQSFNIPKLNFEIILGSKKRILRSFPNINNYLAFNIKDNIKEIFKKIINITKEKKVKLFYNNKDETDFNKFAKEILHNEKFSELKKYKHHDLSIYDHVLKVAKLSYKFAKFLKLDIKSTVRGALLHDFFFYDWRKDKPVINYKKRLHAFGHPIHVYHNASKYFTINNIEKDIIIKHMFPLTIILPKYKESYLVSIIDKIVSSEEFIFELVNSRNDNK